MRITFKGMSAIVCGSVTNAQGHRVHALRDERKSVAAQLKSFLFPTNAALHAGKRRGARAIAA